MREDLGTLFSQRQEEGGANAWHEVSIKALEEAQSKTKNEEEAAQYLISNYTFNERRALAYASYCFWYRPLGDHVKSKPELFREPEDYNPRSKNWNERVGKFVETGKSENWLMNGLLKKLMQLPDKASQNILKETNHRLDLATIAFKAVTTEELGYATFQAERLASIMSNFDEDKDIQFLSRIWPTIRNRKGQTLSEAMAKGEYFAFLRAGLPQRHFQKLKSLGITEVAKKASHAIMFSAKDKSLFPELPEIRPLILSGEGYSGSYFMSPDGKTGGYSFHKASAWTFSSLERFLIACMHESEHLVQMLLASKAEALPQNHPQKKAALIFMDEFQCLYENADAPVSLYAGFQEGSPAQKAYRARPTEFYAYKQEKDLREALAQRDWIKVPKPASKLSPVTRPSGFPRAQRRRRAPSLCPGR